MILERNPTTTTTSTTILLFRVVRAIASLLRSGFFLSRVHFQDTSFFLSLFPLARRLLRDDGDGDDGDDDDGELCLLSLPSPLPFLANPCDPCLCHCLFSCLLLKFRLRLQREKRGFDRLLSDASPSRVGRVGWCFLCGGSVVAAEDRGIH